MPGPFAPSDTLIGAIVHQIALLIQQQIPAVGYVYEDLPDRSPMDNSVVIPLVRAKIVTETNGKVKVMFTFGLRHLFRHKEMSANVAQANTFVMPWLFLLAAWPNQTLSGLAMEVNATDLAILQVSEAGQSMVALAINFDVLTEFNIPLT